MDALPAMPLLAVRCRHLHGIGGQPSSKIWHRARRLADAGGGIAAGDCRALGPV